MSTLGSLYVLFCVTMNGVTILYGMRPASSIYIIIHSRRSRDCLLFGVFWAAVTLYTSKRCQYIESVRRKEQHAR